MGEEILRKAEPSLNKASIDHCCLIAAFLCSYSYVKSFLVIAEMRRENKIIFLCSTSHQYVILTRLAFSSLDLLPSLTTSQNGRAAPYLVTATTATTNSDPTDLSDTAMTTAFSRKNIPSFCNRIKIASLCRTPTKQTQTTTEWLTASFSSVPAKPLARSFGIRLRNKSNFRTVRRAHRLSSYDIASGLAAASVHVATHLSFSRPSA